MSINPDSELVRWMKTVLDVRRGRRAPILVGMLLVILLIAILLGS